MPLASDQFQAYRLFSTGEYKFWRRVGDPQSSEARAWREVHRTGVEMYPASAPSRRWFEASCKVSPIIHVPIR